MTSAGTARRLWALAEPLHALVYFADEVRSAGRGAGLTGFWSTYFALRAAPLGPVGPEVVTATFYNFAPAFVARRVPEVWSAVTPDAALEARRAGVDAAVRRVLGEWVDSPEAAEAATLARAAADAVDLPGRPLAAANAGLPVPAEPHLALWQAVTTLREHRGDGHNAALLQREVSGAAAHVLVAAAGRVDREWLQSARGWDDDAWDAAARQLTGRGWLDGAELSAEGLAMTTAIEADTDRLALGPWRALGDTGCDRLAELLAPVRRGLVAAGLFPDRNPIGVPVDAV
ncbi:MULTISPECIES: SCO6745 family protein [unclassified Geodermatophilus]